MMQQPVEQRGCDHGAAEDVAPFRKAAVRGEDHRPLFVARIDQLEEQIAAAKYNREIADLIDDQKRWSAVEPEPLAQGAFALCFRQSADQVGKCNERYALGLSGVLCARSYRWKWKGPIIWLSTRKFWISCWRDVIPRSYLPMTV